MRHFIHWFFYLSLLSLFGMLSFHAHAQASPCRTTRDQWVVRYPTPLDMLPAPRIGRRFPRRYSLPGKTSTTVMAVVTPA